MQSKWLSFQESVVNTFVGFIFSYTIQITLNYFYNIEMSNAVAIHFVLWFTLASIVRGYVIRRFYNKRTVRNTND